MNGYLWQSHRTEGGKFKRLFLPNGTVLSVRYKRKTFTARVEEGEVWAPCNDLFMSTTPEAFANACPGNTNRNAWLALTVTFPGAEPVRAIDAVAAPPQAPPCPADFDGSCNPEEWARACGHPELTHWFACAMLNAATAGRP